MIWLGIVLVLAVPADTQVVARATGAGGPIEITAGRLKAYAKDNPSRSLHDLAIELVEFELLAAEAKTHKLSKEFAVRETTATALVQRYLRDDFAPRYSKDKISKALVEKAFQQNKGFYSHPELRDGDHILVTHNGKMPKNSDEAWTLIRRVYADLVADPPADREAFKARAKQYEADAEALGFEIRSESLGRFARKGRYDSKFTAPVFEVDQPGTLLEPFETKFGVHIFRLERAEAAESIPLEEVEDEIRERIAPDVQRREFQKLTNRLMKEYGVEFNLGPLEAFEARRDVTSAPAK